MVNDESERLDNKYLDLPWHLKLSGNWKLKQIFAQMFCLKYLDIFIVFIERNILIKILIKEL